MTDGEIFYRGFANIYLQGMDALQPLQTKPDAMVYYVGCPASDILVYDYRRASAVAAFRALEGIDEDRFADVFNNPAWVEIRQFSGETKIIISDGNGKGRQEAILWLGVLYDQDIGEGNLSWKLIRPITDSITAFAAILS